MNETLWLIFVFGCSILAMTYITSKIENIKYKKLLNRYRNNHQIRK